MQQKHISFKYSGDNQLALGFVILLFGFFVATIQNAIIKSVAKDLPIVSILFVQYTICSFSLLPKIIQKRKQLFTGSFRALLILRALLGSLYFYLMFWALKDTSLVDVSILINTAPLWVVIVCWLFMHKSLGKYVFIALIIGFVGVCLILKPDNQIFAHKGGYIALLAGVAMAFTMIVINKVATLESPLRVMMYYSFASTLLMLFPAVHYWKPPTHIEWYLLVLNGFLMVAQQLLIISGFKCGEVSKLSVTTYSMVIYAALFDWLLWGHLPTLMTTFGAFLVIGSGWYILNHNK